MLDFGILMLSAWPPPKKKARLFRGGPEFLHLCNEGGEHRRH
jgi:hypothetical protein